MFPQLYRFTDLGLLLLRLMIGVVFLSSGWSHVKAPAERGQSIGMSKVFTLFLGLAEIAGSLGIVFGRAPTTSRDWTDPDHARRHSEEDLRLAHRLLGREGVGLALRSNVRRHVPGCVVHQRRTLRFDALKMR